MRKKRSQMCFLAWILLVIFFEKSGYCAAPLPAPDTDPFMALPLGVGGDQHYSLANRRYFTNVVAVAVGDLDGDNNEDIVLLANAIPQNGAYSNSGPTQNYKYSHYAHDTSSEFKPGGNNWQGEFLSPGDMLYQAANALPQDFNPADSSPGWFTANNNLNGTARTNTVHYAPPSPNVVAGMISAPAYVGSDLAWLKGDGRGNFVFQFITPNGRPARIRMGTEIRLAKLSNTAVGGLDIVLISATDNPTDGYNPQDSTSLEPFTGASRVAWLENKGMNNGQLQFTDHGIAEYNYDRPPWIFYGAHESALTGWAGPYVSLGALGVEVLRINNDARPDILVANQPGTDTHATSDLAYDDNNPLPGTLDFFYSGSLLRPRNGDRWIANSQYWPRTGITATNKTILWYENRIVGGATEISTSTFHTAYLNDTSTPFTATYEQLVPMQLNGGIEAFVTLQKISESQVYIRNRSVPDELVLTEAARKIPKIVDKFKNGRAMAADINGDGVDELLVVSFGDNNLFYDQLVVYSIVVQNTANLNSIDVTEFYRFTLTYDWTSFNGMAVSDINRDGLNDIFIISSGEDRNLKKAYAATILLNTTPRGGTKGSFVPLHQQKPELARDQSVTSCYSQVGYGDISALNKSMRIAAGDFNKDGFSDFVRVGPKLPVTLFMNNINGNQRSRVTATVQNRNGTKKTWTSILGGTFDGTTTNAYPGDPQSGAGGINIESVDQSK